ncbi:MAG: amidohydrolase family protein [Phycisphaerales bacterium]|nr:amidohydrolase family protein [Phycisphaerales bacterium]
MILQGRILTDPSRPPVPGWIVLDAGRIAEVHEGDPPSEAMPPTRGGPATLITPAFIDAHMHFPQIDSVGCDGLPLLEWLQSVIFPAETWWGAGAAHAMAATAARRLIRQGTCGVAGYLTSHDDINHAVLSRLARETRLRFIAGRVGMDRNAPDALTATDLHRARQRPIPSPLLALPDGVTDHDPRRHVSMNPRFAIACTEELLAEFGWAAQAAPRTFVQTHLSESIPECEFIAELFPEDPHYTGVYDRFGLLHDRTLLAHCVHLTPPEWSLIHQRRSIVVHCPQANVFLESGLFDLDAAREHDIRLALGTDLAAGADVAMPRVARAMIETAKARRLCAVGGRHVPTPAEAWTMITRGNAELLGWADAGRIEAGAAADLLLLRLPETWYDDHLVGRLIYNWDAELIETRIFDGQVVEVPQRP